MSNHATMSRRFFCDQFFFSFFIDASNLDQLEDTFSMGNPKQTKVKGREKKDEKIKFKLIQYNRDPLNFFFCQDGTGGKGEERKGNHLSLQPGREKRGKKNFSTI